MANSLDVAVCPAALLSAHSKRAAFNSAESGKGNEMAKASNDRVRADKEMSLKGEKEMKIRLVHTAGDSSERFHQVSNINGETVPKYTWLWISEPFPLDEGDCQ